MLAIRLLRFFMELSCSVRSFGQQSCVERYYGICTILLFVGLYDVKFVTVITNICHAADTSRTMTNTLLVCWFSWAQVRRGILRFHIIYFSSSLQPMCIYRLHALLCSECLENQRPFHYWLFATILVCIHIVPSLFPWLISIQLLSSMSVDNPITPSPWLCLM